MSHSQSHSQAHVHAHGHGTGHVHAHAHGHGNGHSHAHPHGHGHGQKDTHSSGHAHPTTTRRHAPRHATVERHGVTAVRIRPGHPAAVVDISERGALLDTAHRLLPGHSVELQIQTATDRTHVRARVVRCEVVALDAGSISYRGAVVFERHIPWLAAEGYVVNELAVS